MEYRSLGDTGIKTSVLGLGNWLANGGLDKNVVARALEYGINHFDTADMYANGDAERELGQALSGFDRSDYLITSKCYQPRSPAPTNRGLSRKHISESVERSLKNMGVGHIDMYLCHRYDEATPLAETVRTFEDVIRAGKIMYWGVSRWSIAQVTAARALAHDGYKPVMVQSPYNMLWREEEAMIDFCRGNGMGFVSYSPLAQGALTGKYVGATPGDSRVGQALAHTMQHYLAGEHAQKTARIKAVADRHNIPMAVLALAWCVKNPGVSCAMTGVTRMAQLEVNIAAATLALDEALYAEASAA